MKDINKSEVEYKEWNYINNDGLKYVDINKLKYSRVKVYSNIVEKGEYYGDKNVKSIYDNPRTWCNKYAMELSQRVYGDDPTTGKYPVPYSNDQGNECNANMLFDYFTNHNDIYINLIAENDIKDIPAYIWKIINQGYPVYFSWKNKSGDSGHIEIGVPFSFKNLGNNRDTDDYNTSLNNFTLINSINDPNNNYKSIGAGSNVGFKTYNEYDFLNSLATPFLYLGFLKTK